jgi:DNA polymerase III subunit alpha
MSFVHLHTHSEYSLLDGASRTTDLVDRIAALGMDSVAITDHGNLFGAWKFHGEAKARGIRPILGFEAYVAFGSRHLRDKPADAPAHYAHLVLLAKNKQGYKNLVRLTSIGYLEGYYRRPRIDHEVMEQYKDGIVCLSACLSGEVALWLRAGQYEKAKDVAAWHARLYGEGNYWLEVQDHGLADETIVRDGVQRLSEELGLGIVCTNDAHYLRREDAAAHDVLLAIGTGKDLDDPKRFRFEGTESYVKSEEEMARLFPGRTELLANTQAIADRCEFDFEKRFFLPEFPRPKEYESDDALLIALATAGAKKRYGDPLPPDVQQRLDFELGVITKVGYSGYFLITADFIDEARRRGIPVGPGRGSAAGSIVAFATGITNVDPLKYDLLFERFLNPERISPPDIDVDFCEERRGEIIEYVRERYGRNSVGQIVAYGTMKARAAIKDVARILKVPPAEADRITKLIPFNPGQPAVSIPEAVEKVAELRALIKENPTYQRVVDYGSRIEGLSRHLSVHAAGVVIAPGPLTDYVPVCTLPTKGSGAAANGDDAIVTQYDMKGLEKVGMLKMDFLGLTTLTVLHRAVQTIKARHGVAIDLDTLPMDDPAVYAMLQAGKTAGVFQFESNLATDALVRMRCDRFDDLVATNALVRPGPLDSGMHLVYIRRKRGEEPVRYALPQLQEILAPTYGVIVYQEQVMRIANVLAGYSLAEADVLRKAVGKKDAALIRKELGTFVQRCIERGHPKKIVDDLAGQIETFGRYGFNKSHSVAYSVVAWQTAWLKTHYPAEYMAALLSSAIGDTASVVKYIGACRDMHLEVLAPSVNESGWHFTVVADRRIRFGLGAVRNVGRSAVESILAARAHGPFTSLHDLAARVDLRVCNKRVLEALVASGACDGLGGAGGHRAQLFAALDHIVAEAQLKQAEIAAGQGTLFGGEAAPETRESRSATLLPPVPEWSEAERLAREKELVGFFVSGHPLNRFEREVKLFGTRTTASLEWSEEKMQVAAVVTAVRRQVSKKTGAEWAKLQIEDFHGSAEVLCFPEAWKKLSGLVVADGAYLFAGGFSLRDRGEEQAPFIVEDAQPLAELRKSGRVALKLSWTATRRLAPETARAVAAVCSAHPGSAPLEVEWTDDTNGGARARFRSRAFNVALDDSLLAALRDVLGEDAVELVKVG